MASNITMILPIEKELLADFGEYCRDRNITMNDGITALMRKAAGHKVKRVKLKKGINSGTK